MMPQALWPMPVRRHLQPDALDTLAQGEREVVRLAGFYSDGLHAQRTWQRLRDELGLPEDDLLMLRPEDGVSARFGALAQRWVGRRVQRRRDSRGARQQAATLGALALGGLAWVGMAGAVGLTAGDLLLATASAAGLGALLGRGALLAAGRHGPRHRFDRSVQRQLNHGGHALVVLQVPAHRQADVLGLVRGNSRGWCAEAPRTRAG